MWVVTEILPRLMNVQTAVFWYRAWLKQLQSLRAQDQSANERGKNSRLQPVEQNA